MPEFVNITYMAKSNVKILIVEDDPTLLEMYSIKLEQEGLAFLTATDGEEGLELALAENPSVILLDIMMPKMDGFAVLSELKKNPATKDTPILMLSNLGQKDDVAKGKKLGATDYVIKASMTPTQVVEKIKSYIK